MPPADTAAQTIAPIGVETMIAMNQRGLRAASDASRHFWKRHAALSAEMFRFLDRRLEEDRRVAQELAGCGEPAQAYAVCAAFFETAAKQYAEGSSRLLGASLEGWREGVEDAQRQVEETVEPLEEMAEEARAVAR